MQLASRIHRCRSSRGPQPRADSDRVTKPRRASSRAQPYRGPRSGSLRCRRWWISTSASPLLPGRQRMAGRPVGGGAPWAGLGRQTAIGAVSSRTLRKRPRVTRTSSSMTGSSHVAEGASGSRSMPSSSISVPRTRSGSAGRGRYGGSERIRSLTSGVGSVSCTAGIPCLKRADDGTVDSGARVSTGPRADVRGMVTAE